MTISEKAVSASLCVAFLQGGAPGCKWICKPHEHPLTIDISTQTIVSRSINKLSFLGGTHLLYCLWFHILIKQLNISTINVR